MELGRSVANGKAPPNSLCDVAAKFFSMENIMLARPDRMFDHLEDLHIYARRLTRDADKAQDLVQDAVCHMLSRDVSLLDVDNPRAYLAAILRNLWLDQRRRAVPPTDPIEDHDTIDVAGDAFEELACVETWAAVDRLPAEYATVLRLRVGAGLSYADMAQELGVPVGTVMSRLARAREKLRKML